MKKTSLIFIVFGFLLTACGFAGYRNITSYSTDDSQDGFSLSNGKQIYYTASDLDGHVIPYSGGGGYGDMMMGNSYTCASCHGNDGHGGLHIMHMTVMNAPDITYDGLIAMKQEDSGGNPNEYSLDDLRAAVIEGYDSAGDQLKQDMPRWQMSDQDLSDLLAFLKMLP